MHDLKHIRFHDLRHSAASLMLVSDVIRPSLARIKVYGHGWLNYYGIADMKNPIDDINGWLYHRIHMCIWKQWKKPRTKKKNLLKLGVPEELAHMAANSRRGYWFVTHSSGQHGNDKRKTVARRLL